MVSIKSLIYVGVGGATGSICRYLLSYLVNRPSAISFPVHTLLINLLGSFVIGLLFGLAAKDNNWLNQDGMLLLATGFCGGFTTFSAFALENINLMRAGQTPLAFLYMAISIGAGLLLCKIGITLTS